MAMSFPKTVIASNLPPNAELITHGKNGLLFQSEHADQLAAEMDGVIKGKYDKIDLDKQAFEDIEQHFSPQKIGELYRNVLLKFV